MPTRFKPWFTAFLTALSLFSLVATLAGACLLSAWGYASYGLLPGPLNGDSLYPLWLQPSLWLLAALAAFVHLCWLQRLQGNVLPAAIAYLAGPGPNPLPALALAAFICAVPWWVVLGLVGLFALIDYADKAIPIVWARFTSLFIVPA